MLPAKPVTAETPRLVGGHLALDFVNSTDDEVPADYLGSAQGFRDWCERLGLPSARPPLPRVHETRALLDAVLRPLARGEAAPPRALATLRAREAEGISRAALAPGGWTFTDPLGAIIHAATELITQGPLDRLHVCGNCPWLFLDLSRNGSRRWCSMEGCGTEVKIRRLTERRRAAR